MGAAYIREKAIELRTRKRLTIGEIAERLDISRTTIYYWVGDIPIPRTQRQIENSTSGCRLGNKVMQERYAAKREAAYADGLKLYPELCLEPTFRDFVCLYIGEGFKRTRHVVSVANSDPSVIRAVKPWIERFSANKKSTIRSSTTRIKDLELLRKWWEAELGINGDDMSTKVE